MQNMIDGVKIKFMYNNVYVYRAHQTDLIKVGGPRSDKLET